jgi:hypothetical protein
VEAPYLSLSLSLSLAPLRWRNRNKAASGHTKTGSRSSFLFSFVSVCRLAFLTASSLCFLSPFGFFALFDVVFLHPKSPSAARRRVVRCLHELNAALHWVTSLHWRSITACRAARAPAVDQTSSCESGISVFFSS